MIKLNAQIRVQRLAGNVLLIPSDTSGGPLQAKTVWPSHSEQIIAPDEDYYGLVAVTVKPTPRLPACVTSLVEDGEMGRIVGEVINISTGSTVEERTVESYSYNGMEFPEIPAEFDGYPHRIIAADSSGAHYAFLSPTPWYLAASGSEFLKGEDKYAPRLSYIESVPCWLYAGDYRLLTSSYTVIWSSHDIPNGAADAEEIYFSGTKPVKV